MKPSLLILILACTNLAIAAPEQDTPKAPPSYLSSYSELGEDIDQKWAEFLKYSKGIGEQAYLESILFYENSKAKLQQYFNHTRTKDFTPEIDHEKVESTLNHIENNDNIDPINGNNSSP